MAIPAQGTEAVPHMRNLFFRWRIAAVLLLVAPFVLLASYAVIELRDVQRNILLAEIERAALVTANSVNQQLGTSLGYLSAMATSEAALRNDVPAMYDHAHRILRTLPQATAISLVGAGDDLVFLTSRPLGTKGIAVGDVDAVRRVFEMGQAVISGPFRAPISDRMVVAMGVPVFRGAKVVYCLRMILRIQALNELLLAQKLPTHWTLAIVDGNGALVARSRNPEPYVGKQVPAAIFQAIRDKNSRPIDTQTLEGNPAKAVVMGLPGWDWSVVVGIPAEQFDQHKARLFQLLTLYGAALAVLGATGIYLLLPRTVPLVAVPSAVNPPIDVKGAWPALAALLMVVAIGGWLAFDTQAGLHRLQQSADRRLQANLQRAQLAELLSMLKDLETGQRGFVMTGKNEFLGPYRAVANQIEPTLEALQTSLGGVPLGSFNWRDFRDAVQVRQQLAARAIAARRSGGEGALRNLAVIEEGKLAMDKLRLQVATLDRLLGQHVEELSAALEAERDDMREFLWLTSAAAWLLLVFAIGFWMRERHRRAAVHRQLLTSHAELERRVHKRTAELQIANAHVRHFASESERLVETERTRLSREVHDQVGQIFTGIKMILRTLQPGSLAPEQQTALNQAIDMGVQTSRRIAAELRPPLLDDLGLPQALAHHLRTCFQPLGITYALDMPDSHGLSDQQMTQLFRVVQEACTNICRHARAGHVEVTSHTNEQGLVLYVDDDGAGFDVDRVREGALGLVGIRERVRMMGGTAKIERRPEGGTRVSVHLPHIRAARASGDDGAKG